MQLIISLPRLWVCFFVVLKLLRFAALRSTSLQRWFFARVMESRSTGGPWGSSFMSSWWAACRSSETLLRSCSDRSLQVRKRAFVTRNNLTNHKTCWVCFHAHYFPVIWDSGWVYCWSHISEKSFKCVKAMQIDWKRLKPWGFLQHKISFDV